MQKNYKTFVDWIVWIGIILFLVIHFVCRSYDNGNPWELETLAGDIGYTVSIVGLLSLAFNHLLWRIPYLGRRLHTPDLNGTWIGHGKSSHDNKEYDFTVTIRQTFLQTHVHGYFEKSQSHSFSAVFIHNDTIDVTNFVYSYQNDPKLEYRNKAEKGEEGGLNIHYGTTKLDIDYANLNKLSGTYWNDRNCTGEWILVKLKKGDKDGK